MQRLDAFRSSRTRLMTFLLLMLTMSASLTAQTVQEIIDQQRNAQAANQIAVAAPVFAPAAQRVNAMYERTEEKSAEDLALMTNAVAAAAGTGGTERNRERFLELLGIGLNAIEQGQDKQSVTIRLNPIPAPPLQLGISGTIRKATMYEAIGTAIPQGERAATVALLEKQLDDFDDVTLSVVVSPATEKCDEAAAKRWFGKFGCWGKTSPEEVYKPAIRALFDVDALVDAATAAESDLNTANAELRGIVGVQNDAAARAMAMSSMTPDRQAAVQSAADRIVAAENAVATAETEAFKALSPDTVPETIARLIDNQPAFTVNGSYRDFGSLGGPSQISIAAELQFGFENINTLVREKAQGNDITNKLAGQNLRKDGVAITFSYKSEEDFALAALPGLTVAGFTHLDVPRTSQWQLKGLWGRPLLKSNDREVRLDITGEASRANKGGVRTSNRVVGMATLTIPVGNNFDLPISLSWANKPEFLGESKKDLGAHFSLSYRLPWKL